MELAALFGFLERFGPEVSGRERSRTDAEAEEKLLRFINGECSAEERAEVCEMLRQNPTMLRWIADRVKVGRVDGRQRPTTAS